MKLRLALVVLMTCACTKKDGNSAATPSPPTASATRASNAPAQPMRADKRPTRTARTIVLDGFKLGDSYAALMKRPPYDKPCDDDPVDRAKTTRAMVYGAQPCRGNAFAEMTTLLVFLPYAAGDDFDKPIVAVAWLGGAYFDKRGSFGIPVGSTQATVRAALGKPVTSFVLPDRIGLHIEVYSGRIFAIFDGDRAAGFAIGDLPHRVRAGEEHWRAVAQMYRKYTARVSSAAGAAPGVTDDDCKRLLDKAIALMKADPDHKDEVGELTSDRPKAIGHCMRKLTPEGLRCGLAAKTYREFRACRKKR